MGKSLRQHAHGEWFPNGTGPDPSIEQLKFGTLQRIADALDRIATQATRTNCVLDRIDRRLAKSRPLTSRKKDPT